MRTSGKTVTFTASCSLLHSAMNTLKIMPLTADSWPEVARIYEAGIATKNATFQTAAPEWSAWDADHRKDCRLIALLNDKITGWAALTPISGRCIYAGVAEVSVYIDAEYRGQGIGNQLMKALINASEIQGIWTLQAGIFPENTGSIRLHLKNGFRTIGVRQRIGQMAGVWRDVLLLERRSALVGN